MEKRIFRIIDYFTGWMFIEKRTQYYLIADHLNAINSALDVPTYIMFVMIIEMISYWYPRVLFD